MFNRYWSSTCDFVDGLDEMHVRRTCNIAGCRQKIAWSKSNTTAYGCGQFPQQPKYCLLAVFGPARREVAFFIVKTMLYNIHKTLKTRNIYIYGIGMRVPGCVSLLSILQMDADGMAPAERPTYFLVSIHTQMPGLHRSNARTLQSFVGSDYCIFASFPQSYK